MWKLGNNDVKHNPSILVTHEEARRERASLVLTQMMSVGTSMVFFTEALPISLLRCSIQR